jgi:GLPGLI family protein
MCVKKCYFILGALLFGCVFCSSAQVADKVFYKITYEFSHIYDTSDRHNPNTSTMMLLVGAKTSEYSSRYFLNAQLLLQKRTRASENSSIGVRNQVTVEGRPMIVVGGNSAPTGVLLHFAEKQQWVYSIQLGMQGFSSMIKSPVINWQLENSTRQIAGYICQKAIGQFGGRKYIVWFATAIPFQYGPWKLSGLPGVILEATDANGEVQFMCKEIAKGENDIMSYDELDHFARVDEKKLLKLSDNFRKDPISAARAQIMGNYNGQLGVSFLDNSGKMLLGAQAEKAIRDEAKRKINNPLELASN